MTTKITYSNEFFFLFNRPESGLACEFLIDELEGFSNLVTGASSQISLENWSSLVLPFTQALRSPYAQQAQMTNDATDRWRMRIYKDSAGTSSRE